MTAGRRWLMCSSFGNGSALQRDYGDYGGDTEAIWHARRRRSQASVVDSNKAKVDYEIICFQNLRSEFPRCVNEGPGPHCSRKKKKIVEPKPDFFLACSIRRAAGALEVRRSSGCFGPGGTTGERRPSHCRPSTTDLSIAESPSFLFSHLQRA